MAVLSARERLMKVRPSGAALDQVETVLQALWTARTSLRAVRAEDQLFADVSSGGHLMDKLPTSSQERWDHHIRVFSEDCSPRRRGDILDAWLEVEGGAACEARLRQMARPEQRTGNSNNNTTAGAGGGTRSSTVNTSSGLLAPGVEAIVNALQGLLNANSAGRGQEESGRRTSKEDIDTPLTDEQKVKMMETEEGP